MYEHAEEALEKLKVLNNNFDVIIVAEQLSLDGFLGHEFVEGKRIIIIWQYSN